jgi:hypothetical protein
MRCWGRMMAFKWRKELWATQLMIDEICIFVEEDLHNVTLQEEVVKLDMVVPKGENYISSGAQVFSHIQWI